MKIEKIVNSKGRPLFINVSTRKTNTEITLCQGKIERLFANSHHKGLDTASVIFSDNCTLISATGEVSFGGLFSGKGKTPEYEWVPITEKGMRDAHVFFGTDEIPLKMRFDEKGNFAGLEVNDGQKGTLAFIDINGEIFPNADTKEYLHIHTIVNGTHRANLARYRKKDWQR